MTELLIRYALYLKSNESFEEALEKLNETFEVDNTQENWFALTVRADVLETLKQIDDSIMARKFTCSQTICVDWQNLTIENSCHARRKS